MNYFAFNDPTNWLLALQGFYQTIANDPLTWAFGWAL